MLKKIISFKKNETVTYDLANLPLIDSDNFIDLLENQYFNEFYKQANDLSNKGYCTLSFKDKNWLNKIDNLRLELSTYEEFKDPPKKEFTLARLQDAWLHKKSSLVKEIACEKRILNCLASLYGRKPFPFQTLNFRFGSSQHIHSDSVHFNTLPNGFMCGVWIALEDIKDDAGPLIYYPHSHKTPYISSKSLGIKIESITNNPTPQKLFEQYWVDLISKSNFKKEKFIAKKGDILIWHANLIHGGEIIKNKSLTRWSQVTHYFFENCAYLTPFFDALGEKSSNKKWRKPLNILNSRVY